MATNSAQSHFYSALLTRLVLSQPRCHSGVLTIRVGSPAAVDMGQYLEEVMTYALPVEQMQIQIATVIWATAMNVHPMQMLHS